MSKLPGELDITLKGARIKDLAENEGVDNVKVRGEWQRIVKDLREIG